MGTRRRPRPAWSINIPFRTAQCGALSRQAICSVSGEQTPVLSESKTKAHRRTELAEIELKNVSLSYGKKQVLKNLSLSIWPGEATAIIGTSGTGKSTMLRVISGLEVPESGDVILRGWKRTKSLADEESNLNIAMVFQNSALFDSLSLYENVAFRLVQENKLSDERIYELVRTYLRRVDLEEAMFKYPDQLSGGMRKRASLARAIICDPDDQSSAPDIVLYDEPTAGLDPTASTRIENIIRSVQDICPTCVVVTHQFSTIRRTAERVILMHEGCVAWDGRVEELDTTDNPYVRQFMEGALEGPLNSDSVNELEID